MKILFPGIFEQMIIYSALGWNLLFTLLPSNDLLYKKTAAFKVKTQKRSDNNKLYIFFDKLINLRIFKCSKKELESLSC